MAVDAKMLQVAQTANTLLGYPKHLRDTLNRNDVVNVRARQLAYLTLRQRLGLHSDVTPDKVRAAVDAITRVFEIIQPDPTAPVPRSIIPVHSPEWVADLIAAGMAAGLDYADCVYGAMVRLLHIIAAVHRRNGGRTARPDNQDDIAAALRMMKEKEADHDGQD